MPPLLLKPLQSSAAWLSFGLVVLILGVLAPGFLRRQLIATAGKPGLSVVSHSGVDGRGPAIERTTESSTKGILLTAPLSTLRVTAIWTPRVSGSQQFRLEARDQGRLSLDGEALIKPQAFDAGEWAIEVNHPVAAEPQVLEIDLISIRGLAGLRLLVAEPGSARAAFRPLDEDELAQPDEFWLEWWCWSRDLQHSLKTVGWFSILGAVLMLVVRIRWGDGATALLATVLVIALPAMAWPHGPGKFPFADGHLVRGMAQTKPDYVFIGNSMLFSRIDTQRLGELTGGRTSQIIRLPGTRSAEWYLALKNYVAASGHAPRATFIFFRDHLITLPTLKSRGRSQVYESLSPGIDSFDEPLFESVVYGDRLVLRRVESQLEDWFPAARSGAAGPGLINDLAYHAAIPDLLWGDASRHRQQLREVVNRAFTIDRFRGGVVEMAAGQDPLAGGGEDQRLLESDRAFDFDAIVDASFLPHLARLSKDHDLNLVLVRVQRRPAADGKVPTDPRMAAYQSRLSRWLSEHGIGFHDFTGDPDLGLELYGSGDHIAPESMARYTEIFHDRLREVFER
ncbi:MAG: hypothetical protein KDB53_17480 [Planctomycetes bacterium]|nr:hypothetical protein [Planctomycetota bacterium]